MNSSSGEVEGQIITFYSYKGGVGRTMALANVAWVLASNGMRVLTMDWDLESPGLHRFFRPFLEEDVLSATTGVINIVDNYRWAAMEEDERGDDWYLRYASVSEHAVSLDWAFPGRGALDFVSTGQQVPGYSALAASFDWDVFYGRFAGGLFLEALRGDIKRNYDYCLIDSRTGLSEIADICTIEMPDILVNCFTMSGQSIDGAATVTRSISGRADRDRRVFPVSMRVDEGEKAKVDSGRRYVRSKFDEHLAWMSSEEREAYWSKAEIPYRSFYAFEETLAVFGDAPGRPASLLASFERLTALITSEAVRSLPVMEEATRQRWLQSFFRTESAVAQQVLLSYAPTDRMWAEWIASLLGSAGYRVALEALSATGPERISASGDVTSIVSVLSEAYLQTYEAAARSAGRDILPQVPRLTGVQLPQSLRLAGPFADCPPVNVHGLSPREASEAILHALGEPIQDTAEVIRSALRFPGTEPQVYNIPGRNPGFRGRDTILETMRDRLLRSIPEAMPQVLCGRSGTGKTAVAVEYAHRFMADYDIIWLIPAEDPAFTAILFAQLADQLKLPKASATTETARNTREALRRGDPSSKWLLIFDNAGDRDRLVPCIPLGTGHVIVTSCHPTWSGLATSLQLTKE
ncbi:AAA family ATPase [Nonomuraea sp. PA05]|uniref:KGGVGR-motif variant AAA ATPase n=1 Tax=Nonomuraea sp. PA05 TaxID=2604466 RepID=UPI0011D5B40D|nr:AAA family ATPase [Nonomuraea sp. PA05]TYB66775.1 AAA family ATPase [Nonomuraea sp. PA05]